MRALIAARPAVAEPAREVGERQLRTAADAMLVAINPSLPANAYFTDFAREKLRWMNQEYLAGRLELSFTGDAGLGLPPEVVMASNRAGDRATILLAQRRFADFLSSGSTRKSFTQQQRNDFALALIHEIVHLQNAAANPNDAVDYAQEEFRAWRDVSRHVVRHFRAIRQPTHPTFIDVDDALVNCHDLAPCPALERMVRLHSWSLTDQ